MDSPKQRAIEALDSALSELERISHAHTGTGPREGEAVPSTVVLKKVSEALSTLRSQPDHGVPVAWRHKEVGGWVVSKTKLTSDSQPLYAAPPQQLDALISAGDAMRRSLLGAIPVGPLDKWELDAFNALSDWDAAKAAAPRPHRESSEEQHS